MHGRTLTPDSSRGRARGGVRPLYGFLYGGFPQGYSTVHRVTAHALWKILWKKVLALYSPKRYACGKPVENSALCKIAAPPMYPYTPLQEEYLYPS